MKRFLKYFVLLTCLCLAAFSLSSCFSTEYEYTEWEVEDNTITDGTEVYKLVDLPEGWRFSENNFYQYAERVEVGKNTYGWALQPIENDRIVGLQLHDRNMEPKGFAVYAAEGAEKIIEDLEKNNFYLHDAENRMSAPVSTMLREFLPQLDMDGLPYEDLPSSVLNKAEKIELRCYGAEGFLTYVRGAFYYYNDTVYFLNADEYGDDYVTGGYVSATDARVYEIGDSMRAALKENRKSMQTFVDRFEYEQPTINTEAIGLNQHAAKLMLLILTAFVGIAIPGVPLVLMTIGAFRKKWHLPTVDYVLYGSLAVWLICGIVCFILISV